ncbi:MAG: hypothetical protein ACQEP7_04210 [bacterium]
MFSRFNKVYWVLIIALCVAGGVFSWLYFSSAFPLVDVEISMDRAGALEKAKKIAGEYNLGPGGVEQTASFSRNNEVQNFVELEAGGKEAFREMIREGFYQPFQWHVRNYRPGKSRETTIRFTPTGRPYGFQEKWPEEDTGPALTGKEARKIAETKARENWSVDLEKYDLISSGSNELPVGRVDHTFIYELSGEEIGAGSYRLRLKVSGRQLSEVTRFVKIPEAFTRRYQNMRSTNNFIQNVGNVFVYLGYLLIGCLFGSYWLLKEDALRWRKALAWGGFITFLLFLGSLNSLPLAWGGYDTALPAGSFLARQIVNALSSSLIFGVIITLTFIAAEGLTRQAFGHQPRFWKLWNPRAAGSSVVFKLTLLGYSLTGLYFAYNVGLYSFALDSLGWWVPSGLMYNPNILAHYVVWLEPVVNALRAGFWEECLFRAVPLAGAALLGNRFGRRKWWIGFALVFQALVFGAGHASYATQPAYARMVELFFSSLAMGGLYLLYGLYPVIIIHFIYDLILMAMPIFVATAAGIWLSQAAVITVALVPLGIVLFAWLYRGKLEDLPERFYNRFSAPGSAGETQSANFPVPEGLSRRKTGIIILIGLIGLAGWWGFDSFETYETPLEMKREAAVQRAKKLLAAEGENPDEWMIAPSVSAARSRADAFVWQEGDTAAYNRLMGNYLHGPSWSVRFFSFEGSVEERAEEYRVKLAPGENREQIQHILPESAEGDSLARRPARSRADSAVHNRYELGNRDLKLVRAKPRSRPNRRDWTFVYEDPNSYPLEAGEARLEVNIAGSEVTGVSRYVHVPEDWSREKRSRDAIFDLLSRLESTFLYLLVLAGAFAGLVYWGKGWPFASRPAWTVFALYLLLVVLTTANSWPRIVAGFNTSEPFWNQVVVVLLGRLMMLLRGGFLALVAGFVHARLGKNKTGSVLRSVFTGFGLAATAAGLLTLGGYLAPDMLPPWGDYGALDHFFPWAQAVLAGSWTLLNGSLIILLFAAVYHRLSRANNIHRWGSLLLAVVFGILIGIEAGQPFSHPLGPAVSCFIFALLFAAASFWFLANDRSFVPSAVGGFLVISHLKVLFTASHPQIFWGTLISAIVTLGLAVYWSFILQRNQQATGES